MEALSLIDVSAEDDLLLDLATPPPAQPRHPNPPHAGSIVGAEAASSLGSAAGSPAAAGRTADPNGGMEEQAPPERAESPKQRKAKTGLNLRKSLAWDSAFFTSEGVLDTEELAIVNSTFRKTQGSRLPGIVEEMRQSGESTTSTLESETWVMETLETELFDNVCASIQRSLGKSSKVPKGPAGSSKPPKATANVPRIAARKGVDRMPQIRAPVSTGQGVVGGKQRPQVNSKESAAARVNLPGAAEAKTSSKPPRALPRVAMMRSSTSTATITSATSDKRSSTGGAVNRQVAGKTANTLASVRPGGVTKSSSIAKSGAFTSATTSSHGVSMNTGPEAKTRTTLSNKNRTAQRVPVCSSSKSDISKTAPSRSSGNKISARGHANRASPNISPSSSVDSMSSVISGASSASTIGKMSHTSESLNTLSPSLRKSNDCPPTPKLRPPMATEGHSACGDNSKSTADVTDKGKGFKPTGLRRPTPKIGYFDAEKSIDQNIGAQVQLQPMKIPCLLPVTPKSQPSSTFGQKESKLNAALYQEDDPSKSEAMKALPLNVARMEVEPFKLAEPEVCTLQTDPVVAKPEADKSIDQNVSKVFQDKPATPNSTFVEQESKPIAGPHYEASPSKSKAMPLKAAQMEVEHSEVAEPEVCMHQSSPVVVKPEHDKSIDQNIGAPELALMELQCSHPATPTPTSQPPHEDNSACKSKATKAVPLKAVQMEVNPLKVAEPAACLHKTGLVVTADTPKENIPAVHQNIKANVDASSLVDLLTQKLSSISLGEATPDLAS